MEFTSELRAELKNEVNSRLRSSEISANSESFAGSMFHQLMGELDVRIRRLELQKSPELNAQCEIPASKVNASPHNVAHGGDLLHEFFFGRKGANMIIDDMNQNTSTDTGCPSSS